MSTASQARARGCLWNQGLVPLCRLPADGWDPNGHELPAAAAVFHPLLEPRAGHGLPVSCQRGRGGSQGEPFPGTAAARGAQMGGKWCERAEQTPCLGKGNNHLVSRVAPTDPSALATQGRLQSANPSAFPRPGSNPPFLGNLGGMLFCKTTQPV